MNMKPKAIILFSGGLDSTTCVAIAQEKGFDCYLLTIHYDQKHQAELKAAENIAASFNVIEHKTLSINLNGITKTALINEEISIPDYRGNQDIPVTYVPARNTLFLSLALGWAESVGAQDIFYGANFIDYSGYPDCRPAFIEAFEHLANVATKAGVEGKKFHIHAPLLKLTKAEIILEGQALGIDYSQTVSCYRADDEGRACGSCDSCQLRKKGFQEAGITDVTRYQVS